MGAETWKDQHYTKLFAKATDPSYRIQTKRQKTNRFDKRGPGSKTNKSSFKSGGGAGGSGTTGPAGGGKQKVNHDDKGKNYSYKKH